MKYKIIIAFVLLVLIGSMTANAQQFRTASTDTTTLNAPGYSAAVWCGGGFTYMLWYFKIANINTTVAIVLQMKKKNSEWTNIAATSFTYSANGNYGIEYGRIALGDSVRFRFISEAGGPYAVTGQYSYAKTNN